MADIKHYLQIKKDIENKKAKNPSSSSSSNVVKGAFLKTNNSATNNSATNNSDTNNSTTNNDANNKLDEDEFQEKIRRHRIKMAIIIGLCIIALIVIAVVVKISLDNIKYSGYTIINSINKEDNNTAEYLDYKEGYIRYSNDGISYYTKKGVVIWNQTYQMRNPQVKICGNSLAVGDLNGSSIYVFNETGMLGSGIDTSLPIAQIEVSTQGLVAAVLEDVNVNYIYLYNSNGEAPYFIKTSLSGDGYPLDISISDDATKLITSYVYVDGDSIKSKIVFFSFTGVGQNETDRVVGGFNQENVLVPEVKFINNTCAVAIGENVLSIYKIKEYPSLYKEIPINGEIDRVFISDEYVGMIFKNSESGNIYKMVVYNIDGSLMLETTFNTEYSTIKFDGNSIIMYNDTTFTLMNINGKVQLEQSFDLPINSILSLGSKGNYMLISSKYIQEIKLK